MPRKTIYPLALVLVCQLCALLIAQDKSPRDRLAAAHSRYYTPTASGLKSFHCEAAIDWKAVLSSLSGADVPDDNALLRYLRTVHLSVNDQLEGAGTVKWTAAADPPQSEEDSVRQVRAGIETMISGFFESWNTYMNGGMVPLPDASITVVPSDQGMHMTRNANGESIAEDFDKNMLLVQALMVSDELKALSRPAFTPTPDGLVVTEVSNRMNQPPSASETEIILFHIAYAQVDSYRIPSHIGLEVKGTGLVGIDLNSCQVVADRTKLTGQ
jgi:hypothetical protein